MSVLFRRALGYQLVGELHRPDRLRCHTCGRWTRVYCVQGDDEGPDPQATARWLCHGCATRHRG